MIIGEADTVVIYKVLQALSGGLRRVEAETADGRRVTGYYVTEKQIRIDIVESK